MMTAYFFADYFTIIVTMLPYSLKQCKIMLTFG